MVRETRHLWVGNLPDNIREDRIREHFKRYGRVQNVKLLGRTESPCAGASANAGAGAVSCAAAVAGAAGVAGVTGGVCATVAFMDIKSAAKAHNVEHVLDERTLTTEYYEPAAIPSAAGAPSAGSSPAGSGYSGSSSSVNSAQTPATSTSTSRFHLSVSEESATGTCPLVAAAAAAAAVAAPATWRGTNDSATEYCRRGSTPAAYTRYPRAAAPYSTPPTSTNTTNTSDRTPHHRWYAVGGSESAPSTPGGAADGGAGSVRRRRSGSGSTRSSSSSRSLDHSSDSRASTPPAVLATTPTHNAQRSATASGRPLAICVRNLPTRSSDSSLKDGLYHEYKKHGKVMWVKVVGQNADRYAVVRFKKPSDVEKALEVSQDKLFFGCKISVAPHQSCDEDADSAKPYETDIDEYHPKATRTLFIGNLEKEVSQQQLRDKFKRFGRIIEIDIKKGSGGGAGYAFCQYASISSVVDAIRAMDGEYVGNSRVKLGFGKPVATTCVWVDGLTEATEKQVLSAVSRCGAATSVCVDRAAGAALVHFEQAAAASAAVRELRRHAAAATADTDQRRLMVDYASRECQEAFYEQLEKHGGSVPLPAVERLAGDLSTRYLPPTRHDTIRYEGTPRARASSYGRTAARTPRYVALDHFESPDYVADRRYRAFDELGSSPPPLEEAPYEERLQSVVVSSSPHRVRRHRRDSTPDEQKHSKERHRCLGEGRHRSRSGSRSEHRSRRRHRRRLSSSRAGTPLCDELPEGPAPVEPRRPPQPRDRSRCEPMSLPLPKFAAQLLRAAHTHAPPPAPAAAPASPSRPPSASSESAGEAPHEPSLEERIRSLDEKYEKWNGSRAAAAEAAERGRFRHRLLELDINEVKPSEVVRSLLAKRSVFDEDSERLEGTALQRPPSPGGSPRSKVKPRSLQYPFPTHSPLVLSAQSLDCLSDGDERVPPNGISTKVIHRAESTSKSDVKLETLDICADIKIRPRTLSGHDCSLSVSDPRLNRIDKLFNSDRHNKYSECDSKLEIDFNKPIFTDLEGIISPTNKDNQNHDRDPRRESDRQRYDFPFVNDATSVTECTKKDNTNKQDKKINLVITKNEKCIIDSNKCNASQHLDTSEYKEAISDLRNVSSDRTRIMTLCEKDFTCLHHTDSGDSSKSHDSVDKNLTFEKNSKQIDKKTLDENIMRIGNYRTLADKELDKIKAERKINVTVTNSEKNVSLQLKINEQTVISAIEQNQVEVKKSNMFENEGLDCKSQIEDINNKSIEVNCDSEKCIQRKGESNIDKINKYISDSKKYTKGKFFEENNTFAKVLVSHEKQNDKKDKVELDRIRAPKDKIEREKNDILRADKTKSSKIDRDKSEKERKLKDDIVDKINCDKGRTDREKLDKEYTKYDFDKQIKDREDKLKHYDDKSIRMHEHKKDKDKRKDNTLENSDNRHRKDDKHKYDKHKKDHTDLKRDSKKDHESKSRKTSRDETTRELYRKDSTDSSASRTSHDSSKIKDNDNHEFKDNNKSKTSKHHEHHKQKLDKESLPKLPDVNKTDDCTKIKSEIKEEKDHCYSGKSSNCHADQILKSKTDVNNEKPRHYSVDSPNLETKRKERLNSCSSLPSNIGHKRRMSSQDSIDLFLDESKKFKHEPKAPERRDSKDSRNNDKLKNTKFNKGHFAKLIESKTKDDKKNKVKPPDDTLDWRDSDTKDYKINDKVKTLKKSPKDCIEDKTSSNSDSMKSDGLQSHLDFLATLELRSSEEDEKQRALRKEMKEKKRLHQLQQIQELQKQQGALQQAELMNRKDDKKYKIEDKKKDLLREKRMSTDRKSRDEKSDIRRKSRKQIHSSDTSDSDEPKKHSIFDIVDDEPKYISMYDKVKARSCKNMQKQEEEKRQEKIKAKFCQLKQSRAKREEKKRSSWDEDSDSDHDRKKTQKIMASSSDEEHIVPHHNKRDKTSGYSSHCTETKINDYCENSNNDEESKNKLSRKNSRTRIMSDSSDNDTLIASNFPNNIKKEVQHPLDLQAQDFFLENSKREHLEDSDKIDNNQSTDMHNCKTDRNEIKVESMESGIECKATYGKINNDLSSGNESVSCNRYSADILKRHKRKQKRDKFITSDDELKLDVADSSSDKHRHNSDKVRRHSNKKEKRKDKLRSSVETDDIKDEKTHLKKDKKLNNSHHDCRLELHIKKEGKMEDIFGPLSDESDVGIRPFFENHKTDCLAHSFETSFGKSKEQFGNDLKFKEKDEIRRKREKKRKEKRHIFKDDENSLDVDAAGKAIEASLFADLVSDENNAVVGNDNVSEYGVKGEQDLYKLIENGANSLYINKHNDRHKKENREKRKKKKRSKDDRQKHHNHHRDKMEKLEMPLRDTLETKSNCIDNHENLTVVESQSLPRLTDSPPLSKLPNNEITDKAMISSKSIENTTVIELHEKTVDENVISIEHVTISMDSESERSTGSNISDKPKPDNCIPVFETVIDPTISEDAVRSISDVDNIAEKSLDNSNHNNKIEDKNDEKPRAVISQEETEDAVAALLGESFRGNANPFGNCYNEVVDQTPDNTESTSIENENIPEEDAEEMRQAVQNLNASEMELKPDTPVSDNDLLLIDTDTEEADEPQQETTDKSSSNSNTSQVNKSSERVKNNNTTNIALSKPKQITTAVRSLVSEVDSNKLAEMERKTLPNKLGEFERKMPIIKRESIHQITSTATPVITSATPVITSWTLSNKLRDPHVLNMSLHTNTEASEIKTSNIVQLKSPPTHGVQMNHPVRPTTISTASRINAPYQVINQVNRPTQVTNMQPPTIKIPEPHILYQKQQGIVISPRMANDVRLQSPKASSQGDSMHSPRLSNVTILSTSTQSINSISMTSPTTLQQRSPGQVTVVRMQQPPLSPIQTMHLPHGGRTMVSPNRPNSVLVQTQSCPIQFNRLPVAPVLAPMSKQINQGNILQQNKVIGCSNSSIIHQQKTGDGRIIDRTENIETSKIILSPTNLQQSTNATVMAQNRLISMQNSIHVNNINSGLQLTNKVLLNNVGHISDKRDNLISFKSDLPKSDQHNAFGQAPFGEIHVTSVNQSVGSIIQHNAKVPLDSICSRPHIPNVIHTLNSQRVLTTVPITNVMEIDVNKNPSVFSAIRHPTVLTKIDSSNNIAATTTSLSNVVMTPLILKTTATNTIRPTLKHTEYNEISLHNRKIVSDIERKGDENKHTSYDTIDKRKELYIKPSNAPEIIAKCETDFEELLKDNTNEIKVTNDRDKTLEVNVGKTISHFASGTQIKKNATGEDNKTEVIVPQNAPLEPSLLIKAHKKEIQDIPESTVIDDNLNKSSIVKDNENILKDNAEKIASVRFISPETIQEQISQDKNVKELKSESQYNNETANNDTIVNILNEDKKREDNDNWSAKDVNIESVIKKVDSLCNEASIEKQITIIDNDFRDQGMNTENFVSDKTSAEDIQKQCEIQTENIIQNNSFNDEEKFSTSKRGGRSVRGKRGVLDRIQTKQISKPTRGGAVSKRGRGRAKIDKKLKSAVNVSANNLPGDVYDFHEDSGDESTTSPSKTETRPRLILTIKSPLTGNANATATSTLSITSPFASKEDKVEDFVSPSNTRKSRRLLEKDVQRSSVDDVIEDVIKNSSVQSRAGKEVIKKKPTRQVSTKVNNQDKSVVLDVRKSPRGTKRTKNSSLSDASVDSSDERTMNKKDDDLPHDAKIPKLTDTENIQPKPELEPVTVAKLTNVSVISSSVTTPSLTPIMKPPKKMISEMSAKLGPAMFEGRSLLTNISERTVEEPMAKAFVETDKQTFIRDHRRNPECAAAAREDAEYGRMVEIAPGPVGAMEATDARVQSPALPHRPPSAHRATPVPDTYRAPYAATASLPRGAHHPPPPPHQPLPPHHPHHLHPHPGSARVTITSVPYVSPQGQVGVSSDLSESVRIPPPAHQQTSPITPVYHNGEGMYPHFSQQHYQMYQQHFRATQHDSRASASPYTRAMEAEGSEAPTPPLELRRPPSARVPRPAHSPSLADRLIRCRSPPPAHAGAGVSRLPPALPPLGPPGPPHASQVPREADSLQMLLRRYPVMWQGLLALKNDCAAVQMHFVHGNPSVAGNTLPRHTDGSTPPLRIAQRMRLEPTQLDQVHRKMKMENEHCMLLALPCGRDHMDVLQQSTNLSSGFITYLQRKQAAGIVNVAPPGHHQAMYTVHIFPSCDFANENLNRIAPDLMHRVTDIAHLLIVIATV